MRTRSVTALVLAILWARPGWAAPVQGTVVDAAGVPVAGAQVFAFVLGEKPTRVSMQTDAKGCFTLPGPATILAAAEGHALGFTMMQPDAASVTLTLARPQTLSGHVTGPGGVPLAGATVALHTVELPTDTPGFRSNLQVPEALATRYGTRSGTDGSYRLPGIPPGRVQVRITHPQCADQEVPMIGGSLNVSMEKACAIHGRVVDGDAGVGGCKVTAYPVPSMLGGVGRLNVTTDAMGAFALERLPPRDYDLAVEMRANRERTAEATSMALTEANPEGEVTFRAVRGGTLVIKATDEVTGAPVAGVSMHPRGRDHPPRADDCRGWATDADGIFRARVPAGKVVVEVGNPPERKSIEVIVRDGEEAATTITWKHLLAIAGRVLSADGKPARQVAVGLKTGRSQSFQTTREDGTFQLRGLPDAEVEITATGGDEHTPVPVKVKPPFPAEVVVRMAPRAQLVLVGRVMDEKGHPMANVEVHLAKQSKNPDMAFPEAQQAASTDREGRYRFTVGDLNAQYAVSVASVYQAVGGESTGDSGAERRFADLRVVSLESELAGGVVDGQGRPVPDALVFWPAGGEAYRVQTDANGRFRMPRMPGRAIALVARGKGGLVGFARALPGLEAALVLR